MTLTLLWIRDNVIKMHAVVTVWTWVFVCYRRATGKLYKTFKTWMRVLYNTTVYHSGNGCSDTTAAQGLTALRCNCNSNYSLLHPGPAMTLYPPWIVLSMTPPSVLVLSHHFLLDLTHISPFTPPLSSWPHPQLTFDSKMDDNSDEYDGQ